MRMEEEKGVLELFAPTRINGSEDSTGERHIADLQRVFRRFEEGSRALTRARGLKRNRLITSTTSLRMRFKHMHHLAGTQAGCGGTNEADDGKIACTSARYRKTISTVCSRPTHCSLSNAMSR